MRINIQWDINTAVLVAIMQHEVARLDERVCLYTMREREECVSKCAMCMKAKERRSRESTDPNGMCNYYYQPPQ